MIKIPAKLSATLLMLGVAALPAPASAHRAWMLPSATVLSGNEPWVTVDAASSNDVFYFEHNALQIDNVAVINPDGTAGRHENPSRGRYRSTFDVKLTQKGTYKIAMVNDLLFASYRVGNENKRLRGTAESLAKEIPQGATDLRVTQSMSRMEIFVTSGKPTTKVLEPTGRGLELVPVTHPNDLVAGETAKFRFVLDGKPAAGVNVLVIPGGIRYRDKLEEVKLVTDAQGEFSIKWAQPGMYWMNATPAGERPPEGGGMGGGQGGGQGAGQGGGQGAGGPGAGGPGAQGGPRPQGPAGTLDKPTRRTSYTATLEVLSQ